MSDVPDELLREILSRLPVAPLLRFRCVSKSWKGLIDNDEFTTHHLNHSRKTNSDLSIILGCRRDIYSADFDLINDSNTATFKEIPHPLKTPYCGTEILGSWDGLLVLRNVNGNTILWNPFVRRFYVIPSCGSRYDSDDSFGFGYDVVGDDYKLFKICVCGVDGDEYHCEIKVFSLKSYSWKTIPNFPYRTWTHGWLANGALHWIVTGKVISDRLIAAFDLGTEEYKWVSLPNFAGNVYTDMDMVTLGGCLCLMCYVNWNHVEVWVMKEYGVRESWSVLFSHDFCEDGLMKPLAYSKCGRKVLIGFDDLDLMWYDIDEKSTGVSMLHTPFDYIYVKYTCLQSLLLLDNGTCDFDFDLVTKKQQGQTDTKERLTCQDRR